MKIKEGAILSGISKVMMPVLILAEKEWRKYGKELVITSGLDGTHSAGSLHYYGQAVDCRTRYFDKTVRAKIAKSLAIKLGPAYNIVRHSTHMHIEYDPQY